MAANREDLVRWALERAEENLASAAENLSAGRLHAAAENIFRTVETSLETLLYYHGVRKIEYPGRRKKFVGKLALQFLIRDTLAFNVLISFRFSFIIAGIFKIREFHHLNLRE